MKKIKKKNFKKTVKRIPIKNKSSRKRSVKKILIKNKSFRKNIIKKKRKLNIKNNQASTLIET